LGQDCLGGLLLADLRLLGGLLDFLPAGFHRYPEDVLAGVFVAVFENVTALGLFLDEIFTLGVGGLAQEPLAALFVGVGDLF
jgi:hypothetical protein